ncbi:MAG: molybdenum ABC transporter ATP-binding protein [Acidiferrobacteraceae bacterium]|nr:molybdenum ABC transporter ATP-binding protein [Acidiferrobacteraceae bacterium]|tara:strand:- start:1606 stop:2388 length:783 start_codon:yes stop_codon:yes gene_type:complete
MVPLVEILNATVFRGDTRVFRSFNLSLHQGQNTAILGPNGSGKSTLLKLLTRELYPVVEPGAKIRILGEERVNVWALRSRLGIVSSDLQQNYAAYIRTIEVVVSGFFASVGIWNHHQLSDDKVERSRAVLSEIGIGDLADRPFGQLSTGQQRRVLLARALVTEPANLVLDEPTSGLDLTATFRYLDTLRHLMSSGRTIVLVTHHIHELPPEIERVVLLKEGEVFADGPKASILNAENLSTLFDAPVGLIQSNGWYQAVPG